MFLFGLVRLSKKYGSQTGLEPPSLRVPKGERPPQGLEIFFLI